MGKQMIGNWGGSWSHKGTAQGTGSSQWDQGSNVGGHGEEKAKWALDPVWRGVLFSLGEFIFFIWRGWVSTCGLGEKLGGKP